MEPEMSEIESDEILAEEMVHWSPRHGPLIGSGHPAESEKRPRPGALALGAAAFGALAFGAVAIGALAIGALAIGRLAVGRARFKDLHIDRLVVDDLIVRRRR
jgi:hypothetical protein